MGIVEARRCRGGVVGGDSFSKGSILSSWLKGVGVLSVRMPSYEI